MMYQAMFLKRLYRFMIASGLGLAAVTPATAASYPGYYRLPANVADNLSQYRFRPLNNHPAQAAMMPQWPRYAPPAMAYAHPYARSALPVYAAGYNQPQSWQLRGWPVVMPQQMTRRVSAPASARLPAFARQYGWGPQPQQRPMQANRVSYRYGQSINHYASQISNEQYEQDYVAETSAYADTASFRYRPDTRNVRRVQFTDNLKKPVHPQHSAYQRTEAAVQTRSPVQSNPQQRMRELFQQRQQRLLSAQQYRFRPDPRFNNQPRQPAEPQKVLPVAYKVAENRNPAFNKIADNPWEQWSFRPVDTTF
ncbi:MAG: hypothetical protein PVG66_04690 [Chromatiales bacterium]|jgi:hypothetical protein